MSEKILLLGNHKRRNGGVFMCTILKELKGKTADDLLKKYNVSMEPPIDLERLLSNIGITVVPKDFSDIEDSVGLPKDSILGATISNEEDLTIFHSIKDTENRKRFTLAHELAHCCLHTGDLIKFHIELRETAFELRGKEYDANVFAGELLIPESALKKVYNQLLVPSVSALMQIFKVSSTVMIARLDYLSMPYYKDV